MTALSYVTVPTALKVIAAAALLYIIQNVSCVAQAKITNEQQQRD